MQLDKVLALAVWAGVFAVSHFIVRLKKTELRRAYIRLPQYMKNLTNENATFLPPPQQRRAPEFDELVKLHRFYRWVGPLPWLVLFGPTFVIISGLLT